MAFKEQFKLYFGKKYKKIQLEDSYILSSKLTRKVNEPHELEIVINLKYLLTNESREYFNALLDINCELYLEVDSIQKGFLFSKKHNQNGAFILIQKDDNNTYKLPNYTETLPSGFFEYISTYPTVSGPLPIYGDSTIATPTVGDFRLEYVITDNKTTYQNMINSALRREEVSITGQTLDNDTMKLTFYSTIHELNYRTTRQLSFGTNYQESLSQFLNRLANSSYFKFDVQGIDYQINYTVEPKQPLEILDQVLVNRTYRDGGYDVTTGVQTIEVYDSEVKIPTIRALSIVNNENPYILDVRENYPTISCEFYQGNQYIREGDKALLNFSNVHTTYNGSFMIYSIEQDLVFPKILAKQTMQLLKTNRDVRRSYIESNIRTLNNRLI